MMEQGIRTLLSGRPAGAGLTPDATARYFKDAVTTPMLRTFDEQIAPRIREAFGGVGAFSSRLGQTIGRAAGDLSTSLASQLAQAQMENARIRANLENEALGRIATGVSATGAWNQQGVGLASALQQGLAPLQGRTDLMAQTGYNEFLRTDPMNSPILNLALGTIGTPMQQLYKPSGGVGGAISGAMGGGLSGALLASSAGAALGPWALLGGAIGGIGGLFS